MVRLSAFSSLCFIVSLLAQEGDVRYFHSEKAFLRDVDVSLEDLSFRRYIKAQYDSTGRLIRKAFFKSRNRLDRFERFEYDIITGDLSIKSFYSADSILQQYTYYGSRDSASEKFIRYTYGVSKVRDYDDRYTSVEYTALGHPQIFRFYDVNGFMYGVIELKYNAEGYLRQEDWILMPQKKVIRRYVKNFDVRTGETDIWEYDSTLTIVNTMTINRDGVAPIISISSPADSIPINSPMLTYNLKEDLSNGELRWDWIGGKPDSSAPYICPLIISERTRGLHEKTILRFSPDLQDSSIYRLTFSGIGESGYKAQNVILSKVSFDTTGPTYTVNAPAHSNRPVLSYNLNEALRSAEVVWVWEEGDKDETSPHIVGLSEGMLNAGQQDSLKLDKDVNLLDGTTYSVLFQGKDIAGNRGPFLTVSGVTYDTTRPEIVWRSPETNGFTNSPVVSFVSSEDLGSAEIRWEVKEETEDGSETQIVDLMGTELDQGEHLYETLSTKPNLLDGKTYTITMTARDLAGNEAVPVIMSDIMYDISSPTLSTIAPEAGISVRDGDVIYVLNEDFASAEIDWVLDGEEAGDPRNISIPIKNEGLSSGDHRLDDSTFIDRLTDGGLFTIRLTGRDKAGNEAVPSSISGVTFDVTAPEFLDIMPGDCTFVMSPHIKYALTEDLSEGTVIWTQVGGEPDFSSPQMMEIPLDALTVGVHDSIITTTAPILQDGSIYVVSFMGVDAAGNRSVGATSKDVMYDITPPEIVFDFPNSRSHIANTALTYKTSEGLKSGTVVWEWIDGILDIKAPHSVYLNGSELTKGAHESIELAHSPQLVSGAIYHVTIKGQDFSGKASEPIIVQNVTFDDTHPEVAIKAPLMGAFRNRPALAYYLSEPLASAFVIWERKGGAEDASSPHIVSLESTEMIDGSHPDSLLVNLPFLKDGTVYDLFMVGIDSAGNSSDSVSVTGIVYDTTPPNLEVSYPISSMPTSNSEIAYTVSEQLKSGEVIWDWISGEKDSVGRYVQEMSDSDLIAGEHQRSIIHSSPPSLIEGAVYTVTVNGVDLAGNSSAPVIVDDVRFDATAPIFADVKPDSGGYVNSTNLTFSLSETIVSGKVIWESQTPELDPELRHIVELTGDELLGGFHENMPIANAPILVDGAVYTISIFGADIAENLSDTVMVEHITYDAESPVVELSHPIAQSFIKSANISYLLSEDLSKGFAVWERTGGFRDTADVHEVEFVNSELKNGEHIDTRFYDQPRLEEGAIYRLTVSVSDRAGNESEPVALEGLKFDATAPLFDDVTPTLASHINAPLFGFWVSENLEEGSLTWNHIGGEVDDGAPHVSVFSGAELNAGTHASAKLTETPSLVDGAIYSLSLLGRDSAGNLSDTLRIDSVHYDITAPLLTVEGPDTNSFVNTPNISYSLSETLKEGSITFRRTGGKADPISPHLISIPKLQLSEGFHDSLDQAIWPQLMDGTVYRMTYTGADRAGNKAEVVSIDGITYDVTAPIIAGVTPEDSSEVNHVRISYSLSETMVQGGIRWNRTGGADDLTSPHIINLTVEQLTLGLSNDIDLGMVAPLIDGAVYTMELFGEDAAGNSADTVRVEKIYYDVTSPRYAVTFPLTDSYVRDSRIIYSISEKLKEGTVTWAQSGGVADNRSPHVLPLTQTELLPSGLDGAPMTKPLLVDGAIYSVTFEGVDVAGNSAEKVSLSEVKIDYSPPVLALNSPLPGAVIRDSDVVYNISESLRDGTMIWTQVDGPSDPSSPHTVPLDSDELAKGDHADSELIFPPLLTDGAVYDLRFFGVDYAGNLSDTLLVEGLRYDVTPPIISVTNPVTNDYLNTIAPSFSFTEDMLEASIVWTRIEGSDDSASPHNSALTGQELVRGDHLETALLNLPALVDGAIYSVTFSGIDLAGNKSDVVFIDRVAYDVSSPVITVNEPKPNIYLDEAIVSFSLSEDLDRGELIWQDLRNSANSQSMKLPADLCTAGDHFEVNLSDSVMLSDGSIYSLLFAGVDRAGNEAEAVSIENVGFDMSPPTLIINNPTSGDYINSAVLAFNLSEELKEGTISWVRTGGSVDGTGNRITNLEQSALIAGDHPEYAPTSLVPLISGTIYSVTLQGIDLAGNAGVPVTIENLSFDNTSPIITTNFPAETEFVNTKEVGYSLSEQFGNGMITWERVGGSTDPFSPHEVKMTDVELVEGDYRAITAMVPNLVDGAQYDIVFNGEDMAGNIAESVLIPGITYDVSVPVFTMDYPVAMSAVNSEMISYNLSEPMVRASLKWKRVAGVSDPRSPQSVELLREELNEGRHEATTLSKVPVLIDGAIYDITSSGSDRAGNMSIPVTVNQVLFDVTPPTIVASKPTPRSFVQSKILSYSLSETLAGGSVTWTRIGGNVDAGSPHKVDFSGLELAMGEHNDIVLINDPSLVSGAVYSVSFQGRDMATNIASGMTIEDVTFDNTPPLVTLQTSTGSIAINEPRLTYTISENAVSGMIVFERSSGSADPNSPHKVILTETELSFGEHAGTLLVNNPTLVDGANYRVTLSVSDAAGNQAEPVRLTGILYDSVSPVVTLNSPLQSRHVRVLDIDYTLSEAMASATATWTRTAGSADSQSPRVIKLSVPEMAQGNRSGLLSDQMPLIDGSVYTLTLSGSDAAGNEAVLVSSSDIKYDTSPPQFSNISPSEGYTNGRTLSYTLSETMAEGSIVFASAGGILDSSAPHTVSLSGNELTAGVHNADLLDAPTLLSGASYELIFSGIDSAGNASEPFRIGPLMFDNTPPVVMMTGPLQGSKVNKPQISYELSESLASGTVTWIPVGGSPQVKNLLGSELDAGIHGSVTLSELPSLSDGTTYSITFSGNDAAGNPMEEVMVRDVTFDTTPPKISIDFSNSAPSRGLFNYKSPIGMAFSEDMGEVTFRWEREGGSEDPDSPHTLFVADSDLANGNHPAVQIPGAEKVLIGTSYTLTVEGKDRAGNPAKGQTVENIDIVRPLDGEWSYQGIAIILWSFTGKNTFNQGVLFGNTLGDEKPGQYAIDWSKRPFRLAIKYDDGTRRYGLFEFIGHNRLRVVSSSEKRPSSWSDGDYFEFDYREKNIP